MLMCCASWLAHTEGSSPWGLSILWGFGSDVRNRGLAEAVRMASDYEWIPVIWLGACGLFVAIVYVAIQIMRQRSFSIDAVGRARGFGLRSRRSNPSAQNLDLIRSLAPGPVPASSPLTAYRSWGYRKSASCSTPAGSRARAYENYPAVGSRPNNVVCLELGSDLSSSNQTRHRNDSTMK
jgi:hypothetical protein